MLKKLVKYGNSNALILDKAILELLNFSEGSIVIIKTDGTSLIITPQSEIVTQQVTEVVTSSETLHQIGIRGSIAYYKDFDAATQKILEKEISDIMNGHAEMVQKATSNPEFQKELQILKVACASDQEKLIEMSKDLMEKYIPELADYPKKLAEFDKRCRILAGKEPVQNMEQMQKDMNKEFQEVFAKHKDMQMAFGVAMQSPEYLHRSQLLTEKFQDNQSSQEFFAEMKKLMYEFCPEMEQLHKEIEVIGKKYNNA